MVAAVVMGCSFQAEGVRPQGRGERVRPQDLGDDRDLVEDPPLADDLAVAQFEVAGAEDVARRAVSRHPLLGDEVVLHEAASGA